MAASSEDKDFVHLLLTRFEAQSGKKPKALVKNIAEFERNYATFDVRLGLKDELAFQPDLIIVAVGENVPPLATEDEKTKYHESYSHLLKELKSNGNPRVIVRSCFWADPAKDGIMHEAAKQSMALWVDIAELGKVEANVARSERSFKHEGVAGHPGDRGMEAIANAIWSGIQRK